MQRSLALQKSQSIDSREKKNVGREDAKDVAGGKGWAGDGTWYVVVTGWAGGGSWNVVVPGVTVNALVASTCSGCARKVTGTKGCVGGRASGCGWAGVAAVAAVAVYDGENGFVERVGERGGLSKSSALSLSWRTSCSWWA